MGTTFAETPGYPHAHTTIVELEQIAAEPKDGFGRAVRGAYFEACLRADGSLTVYFPGDEDGPRRTLRYTEVGEAERGRLTMALANAVGSVNVHDLAFRIWIQTGPASLGTDEDVR